MQGLRNPTENVILGSQLSEIHQLLVCAHGNLCGKNNCNEERYGVPRDKCRRNKVYVQISSSKCRKKEL
jgi:hypothetical protein